ncbi:MAG: hypothetical protein KDB03_07820 [Planctomycetales bacterium]|nr:hypothetical protein [Planctomycetales bacterium]
MLQLKAGQLELLFDTELAFARYIKFDGEEVLRGIYAAVRDCDWNTVPFTVSDLQFEQTEAGFQVEWLATSLHVEVAYQWKGILRGSAIGELQFSFDGLAKSIFKRNRIGFCVLHAGEQAGVSCTVEHTNGSLTQSHFPYYISPHQPFSDIRAISHRMTNGNMVEVKMCGDTFEMEDQRNWTDDSFKTYCTPLELPFPVVVHPGDRVEQHVQVRIEPTGQKQQEVGGSGNIQRTCRVEVDWDSLARRPGIGFGLWGVQLYQRPYSDQESVRTTLAKTLPDYLRVDLRLFESDWLAELSAAVDLSGELDCQLEIALTVESTQNRLLQNEAWNLLLTELEQLVAGRGTLIRQILLYDRNSKTTPKELSLDVASQLCEIVGAVPIIVGSNAYFTELNRGRPYPVENFPVCYSINPQVHAFDNRSVAETIEAQKATLASAVAYFGRRVAISPVSLRPRFNPNATRTLDPMKELESGIDPRQNSGFAAAWTVGVASALLVHSKLESLTLYEVAGPRGIMSYEGTAYPMLDVCKYLLNQHEVASATTSNPLSIVALGAEDGEGTRSVIVGNMSDQKVYVCIDALESQLDAESFQIIPL